MEHFGLKSLDDLPGTDELRRMEAEQSGRSRKPVVAATAPEEVPEDPNQLKIEVIEAHVTVETGAVAPDEEEPIEREVLSEEEIIGGEDEEEEEYDDDEEDDDDEDDEDDDDDDEDEEEEE